MIKPDATVSLVIEREMPHPPEKIWRALTQSPLIEEWLMKNDFQPVVGHPFNFRATPVLSTGFLNLGSEVQVLSGTPANPGN